MIVGYIRMCTQAEDRDREKALHQWGAEKLYWEKDSSRSWVRPAYEGDGRPPPAGDTVVASEFRQLSAAPGCFDTAPSAVQCQGGVCQPGGEFPYSHRAGAETLRVLSALAEMEEERMLRRQKKMEKAKAAGRYKGRTPLAMMRRSFGRSVPGGGRER